MCEAASPSPPPPCEDAKGTSYCEAKLSDGKCSKSSIQAKCELTCGVCEDSASSCAAEIEELQATNAELQAYEQECVFENEELLLRAEEDAAQLEGLQASIAYLQATNAELEATIASMTSPSPPPSPPPPPGADYPCDSAYNLFTLTEAYDWYAPHEEDEHTRVKLIGCMHARASATRTEL